MSYTRFAIYYVPPAGKLAEFGAQWLGWDVLQGMPCKQPDMAGFDDITMTPRKYGFHGTLKPPFRLAKGCNPDGLAAAVERCASGLAPVACDGLKLNRLGRFLALTPTGDMSALERLAAELVTGLDAFRAPAGADELARRRAAGLTPTQDAHLQRWGYPYVFDEFRFHLTLTGKLPEDQIPHWQEVATRLLPDLPTPFVIDSIALVGERADGRFELIQRYPLRG